MRFSFLFFLLILNVAFSQAQTRDTVVMLSHFSNESSSLQLKWLSKSHQGFVAGFKNGYNLYRAEAVSNPDGSEKLLPFEKLNQKVIMHWSKDKIKREIENDSSVSIASMFINNAEEFINPAPVTDHKEAYKKEQSYEFLMLLGSFSAIVDNKVAEAMGMYFEDVSINPSKKYLYKIEIPGHPDYTSYTMVLPLGDKKQTKVMGLTKTLLSEAVRLDWYNNNNLEFPYYNIYRSESKNSGFSKLNELPYIGNRGQAVYDKKLTSYIDSFPEYEKTYYYKVVGVNAFEAEGTPSDVVEVKTSYLLKERPVFGDVENINDKSVKLQWVVTEEDKPYIQGFSIKRASSGQGDYKKVNEKMIKPNVFTYEDMTPLSSNYYSVCAYGKNGDSLCSVMRAILLKDSIPPAKPEFISGTCDTNGIVTITWKKGIEEDLKGYRIFRTFQKSHEPVRVTVGDIADTSYIDTVSIYDPYNSIFYKLIALDKHYNPSLPSDMFEVKIPDFKPPTNGYLEKYSVDKKGITLSFNPSNAYDLKYMYLMRKSKYDLDYKEIVRFAGDSLTLKKYTDTSTKSNTIYHYCLVAEDESGLQSSYSKPMVVKQMNKEGRTPVTDLKLIPNRDNKVIKISWTFPKQATGFRIYRAEAGKGLTIHKYVPGNVREYYDKNVKPNKKYTYVILGELPGGYKSGYSKKVEVKY